MASNHVNSVKIGELISISLGGTHKVGKVATFDLTNGSINGQNVGNVRTVRGPTSEGVLLVEIKSGKNTHFKLQLDIVPSTNTFSVLMYNVGPEHEVSVPGLKRPLKLSGPAFILVGTEIFAYDGEELRVHHGFIVESHPLLFFMVGRNVMIQNQFKRKSIKLPSSVSEKGAVMVAYINLANNVDCCQASVCPVAANGVLMSSKTFLASHL